jgi:hypothetical protein
MNGNFDGGHGMYGAVLVGALMELGGLVNQTAREQRGASRSWSRVVLVLAVVVAPVALLLAGGLGS